MNQQCREVLDHLWAFLDGETHGPEADHIRDHLEGCEPCLSEFDFQEALKVLVRRSCRENAPASLRARIITEITRLRTDGAEVTTSVTQVRVTTER